MNIFFFCSIHLFFPPEYAVAHSMGLGKSLTTISLLFTLLNHPSLTDSQGKGFVRTAMLVVPVNTIASWKSEFDKWTRRLKPSILIYNLQSCPPDHRQSVISQWRERGGVLLLSKASYLISCCKDFRTFLSLQHLTSLYPLYVL